jgi:hypothetical protein
MICMAVLVGAAVVTVALVDSRSASAWLGT